MMGKNLAYVSAFTNQLFQRVVLIRCFVLICLFTTGSSVAQTYSSQKNQILAYNILLNGCIGGIGGAINKDKDERVLEAFGKNFLKGGLGGLVKYTAKYETYRLNFEEEALYAIPNRLFFFAGHSFTTNATLNRSLLHTYNAQFWGIDLNVQLQNQIKLSTRISLLTAYELVRFSAEGHKLDLNKSLKYGLYYFHLNPEIYKKEGSYGLAGHNVIAISNPPYLSGPAYDAIPHEVIHTYQFYDFFPLTNFFYPKSLNSLKEKKIYRQLSKYFYLEVPYYYPIYFSQHKAGNHYSNFFEFEAEHFCSRQYVDRK